MTEALRSDIARNGREHRERQHRAEKDDAEKKDVAADLPIPALLAHELGQALHRHARQDKLPEYAFHMTATALSRCNPTW
jgi:hypothetical protein